MALKLFRTTGYSSILSAGETRAATHPGWLILAISLWTGLACNVALWRALSNGGPGLARAFAFGALVAAACGAVLSLLGWRKTLKPAATLVLLLAALAASSIWERGMAVDASLLDTPLPTLLAPHWDSLLRWQVPALLAALALLPAIWMWNTHIRRLPGPNQLSSNVNGIVVSVAVLAASGFLWLRVLA